MSNITLVGSQSIIPPATAVTDYEVTNVVGLQNGDWLIVTFMWRSGFGGDVTPPAEFTLVERKYVDATGQLDAWVGKRLVEDASLEPASYTFTLPFARTAGVTLTAFRGGDETDIISDSAIDFGNNVPDFPSVTLDAPGGVLLAIATGSGDSVPTTLSGFTTITNTTSNDLMSFDAYLDDTVDQGVWPALTVFTAGEQQTRVSVALRGAAPPVGVTGSPTDRYRLNLSADSRSLLASASAVPFDASATVNLPPAVGLLPQQTLYPVRELTRDATGAAYDAVFYPRATQNATQERQYDGVTLLTRMQSAYPARIFDTTTNLGVVNNQAPAIITYVFSQWATQFPWFTYETVPRLRLPLPGSTGVRLPSEYSTVDVPRPREGGIGSTVIALPQDEDNRRSMYDILEDLLSPFPGAVFFMNAAGRLQIVPAYGPDADETPYKTLGDDDVTSISLGEPSISTIINRCTVSSRGYQRSEGVPLMQPAWFQVGAQQLFGQPIWYDPPVDRVNLQDPAFDGAGQILQETDLTSADGFTAQTPGVWPIATDAIPAGEGISLVDGADASLVTVGWSSYNQLFGIGAPGAPTSSGTTGLTLLRTFIPFGGDFEPTFRWDGNAGLFNFVLQIDARWDAEQGGIAFRLNPSSVLSRSTGNSIITSFVVEFTLNDESVGYAETQGVTATYGTLDDDEDSIPNADGSGNAVADSQTAFGVQEERIDVRGYVLNAEQALAMAQGYVLANLTPRAIKELDLGWRGSTVAQFDDRGRLFGTPNSGEGLLVGVQYNDDFISVTGGKRVRVEEKIPGTAGFISTDITWLLADDGSFWENDDATLSEPA